MMGFGVFEFPPHPTANPKEFFVVIIMFVLLAAGFYQCGFADQSLTVGGAKCDHLNVNRG